MSPVSLRLPATLALILGLAACDVPPPTPAAPDAAPPATGTDPATPAPAPAPPAPRAGLTREGVQTVTLDLRNATDTPIVELNAVEGGRNGPNLLPPGTAIPAGGTVTVPAAAGRYLLRAQLQAASVFTPGRQILRHVIVPRFPPNPPPRMTVTLR